MLLGDPDIISGAAARKLLAGQRSKLSHPAFRELIRAGHIIPVRIPPFTRDYYRRSQLLELAQKLGGSHGQA